MRITIQLYNELRSYMSHLPTDGSLDVPEGTTACDVLRMLGIPENVQAAIALFCNGRPADRVAALQQGDRLVAFSPMSGG